MTVQGSTSAFSDRWVALGREAESSAEHLAIGVTALGRANYAQDAYYVQAFFALSVGLERSAKLALLLDHVATTGAFPSNDQLRKYGHNLRELLAQLEAIARRRNFAEATARFPTGAVPEAIVDILTTFADNTTRYYNLDLLTASPRIAGHVDPVADWWNRVTLPIIQSLPEASLRRVLQRASAVDAMLSGYALTRFTAETGELMTDVFTTSARTGMTELARPHQQLAVLQFARTMGRLVRNLEPLAQAKSPDIPFLHETFAIYNNDDRMLRSRKTWSIYRR